MRWEKAARVRRCSCAAGFPSLQQPLRRMQASTKQKNSRPWSNEDYGNLGQQSKRASNNMITMLNCMDESCDSWQCREADAHIGSAAAESEEKLLLHTQRKYLGRMVDFGH